MKVDDEDGLMSSSIAMVFREVAAFEGVVDDWEVDKDMKGG